MTAKASRSSARGHRGIRLNPSIHDAAPANTPLPSGPPTIHPAAELFPLIDGADFDALVLDIKTNGLIEPIILLGNQIIDGRNRLRACEAAGLTPRYREVNGIDPTQYVVSRNLHRRHLTTAQRAAIAAELANQQHGGDRKSEVIKGSKDPLIKESATSIEDAAQLLKVSTASVKRAKQLLRNDPSAHAAVKRGEKPTNRRPRTSPTTPDVVPISVTPVSPEERAAWEEGMKEGGRMIADFAERQAERERVKAEFAQKPENQAAAATYRDILAHLAAADRLLDGPELAYLDMACWDAAMCHARRIVNHLEKLIGAEVGRG